MHMHTMSLVSNIILFRIATLDLIVTSKLNSVQFGELTE